MNIEYGNNQPKKPGTWDFKCQIQEKYINESKSYTVSIFMWVSKPSNPKKGGKEPFWTKKSIIQYRIKDRSDSKKAIIKATKMCKRLNDGEGTGKVFNKKDRESLLKNK